MSKTGFATNDAEVVKLWHKTLFEDTLKKPYFSRFMGSSADSIVQVKQDLEKSRGDRITFALRSRLTNSGVTEGQTLEGNEASLETYTHNVTLTQIRNAVRDNGAMSRQRAMFSIDDESKAALQGWMTETIDQKCMDALVTSPTCVAYLSGSTNAFTTTEATAIGALTTSGKITLSLITYAKTLAVTGRNRAQTPLRPVMVDGKKYFVLVIHPDVEHDLKLDAASQGIDWYDVQKYARERGPSNPIFSGAIGEWDGVIIHSHENVPIYTNGGSGANVPYAKCSFIGAQALVWAWGKRPEIVTEDFDFKNEKAYGTGMIYGVNKPVFNSVDYGSFGFYVNRTKISDQ